jgi:hypothetical protein
MRKPPGGGAAWAKLGPLAQPTEILWEGVFPSVSGALMISHNIYVSVQKEQRRFGK